MPFHGRENNAVKCIFLDYNAVIPYSKNMNSINSFPPLCNANAKVLILGSIPGEASLAAYEYYAHPRNVFWPIMSQLFGVSLALDYQQRCKQLVLYNIALWDVLARCQRKGSLDSNIINNSIVTNNFNDFFNIQNKVTAVFFNGAKSEKEYVKQVIPHLKKQHAHIQYQRLPSTSPAMASISFEQKTTHWSIIKEVLYAPS